MKNVFWGLLLVIFGTLLLLDNLGIADMGDLIHQYWPLILVILGLGLLLRHKRQIPVVQAPPPPPNPGPGYAAPQGQPSETHDPISGAPNFMDGDILHHSEVFGDTDLHIRSQNFLGGSVSAVFGDIHLDLSGVTIAQGEHILRVHSVFGNSRIILPQNVAVSISANTTFGSSTVLGQHRGGFSSFMVGTTPEYASAPNRLKISISKVFGDLYVA